MRVQLRRENSHLHTPQLRPGKIDRHMAASLLTGSLSGVVLGSLATRHMSTRWLRVALATGIDRRGREGVIEPFRPRREAPVRAGFWRSSGAASLQQRPTCTAELHPHKNGN